MSDFAALHAAADHLECQVLVTTFRIQAQNKKIEACRILRLNRARALRLLREADDLHEQAETLTLRMMG